ncbi:SDR family oxidoreductase [Parvularcula sp. ZS-1/3]|uniref:SDR family oxidoreductase n=1 Tax=Parvularcula mediterranea TaxID=2732508 RepID=A0A7Y3RKS4_9PROT|nr:SDR family oxidoreductase [Parvularcula mediterranea]NNU15820.1 SDR family oxidoreductase [Parvularcula mediterranea]
MAEAVFLGLGYTARPLAEELACEGWQVTGTTRDRAKAMTMTAGGIRPLVWEAPAPLPEEPFETADLVVISTAPKDGTCPALSAVPFRPFMSDTKLLYLSSSGVYGDFGGEWVDEETRCNPGTERGRDRLAAEKGWQALADETRADLTLCRLAGIYGPGRSAVDSLRGDTPGARAGLSRRLIKPGQVFNRIHRDDIVRGLKALIDASATPGIVNFTDDLPTPPAEPITYAAELLGIEPPPEVRFEDIEDELSPMARSFYAENKRLKNDRLKALVGDLHYPSYREGLSAIYKGSDA